MKASHRKAKHDRRVHHQRAQRLRKQASIDEVVDLIKTHGDGKINKKNMIPNMESRGYYYVGTTGSVKESDLMLLGSWKRMARELPEPKEKISPTRRQKQQRKVVPGS